MLSVTVNTRLDSRQHPRQVLVVVIIYIRLEYGMRYALDTINPRQLGQGYQRR